MLGCEISAFARAARRFPSAERRFVSNVHAEHTANDVRASLLHLRCGFNYSFHLLRLRHLRLGHCGSYLVLGRGLSRRRRRRALKRAPVHWRYIEARAAQDVRVISRIPLKGHYFAIHQTRVSQPLVVRVRIHPRPRHVVFLCVVCVLSARSGGISVTEPSRRFKRAHFRIDETIHYIRTCTAHFRVRRGFLRRQRRFDLLQHLHFGVDVDVGFRGDDVDRARGCRSVTWHRYHSTRRALFRAHALRPVVASQVHDHAIAIAATDRETEADADD